MDFINVSNFGKKKYTPLLIHFNETYHS